jgi:hypothetical protein
MKKVSLVIPCYNEEGNVIPICNAIKKIFSRELSEYDYELIFIDNKSKDNTRNHLRLLCKEDKRVKAIFNITNFGQNNSPFYGLLQSTGDCVIHICADFQDPVEMIPVMVREWEKGNKVISMIKKSSKENKLMYFFRTIYYKLIKTMSKEEQIEHFTGFGLYDRSFIEILRKINEPIPLLRGIVAEYAPDHLEIEYEQQLRKSGKTSNNFFSLFDVAMLSFTSYTKSGLRIATFFGFIVSLISFLISVIYFILKILYWNKFNIGTIPILVGVFFLGGLQLFFIGLLGEYIMNMNIRIMNRPLVIEEERINFKENKENN